MQCQMGIIMPTIMRMINIHKPQRHQKIYTSSRELHYPHSQITAMILESRKWSCELHAKSQISIPYQQVIR
jgi:hypothetical protein